MESSRAYLEVGGQSCTSTATGGGVGTYEDAEGDGGKNWEEDGGATYVRHGHYAGMSAAVGEIYGGRRRPCVKRWRCSVAVMGGARRRSCSWRGGGRVRGLGLVSTTRLDRGPLVGLGAAQSHNHRPHRVLGPPILVAPKPTLNQTSAGPASVTLTTSSAASRATVTVTID